MVDVDVEDLALAVLVADVEYEDITCQEGVYVYDRHIRYSR